MKNLVVYIMIICLVICRVKRQKHKLKKCKDNCYGKIRQPYTGNGQMLMLVNNCVVPNYNYDDIYVPQVTDPNFENMFEIPGMKACEDHEMTECKLFGNVKGQCHQCAYYSIYVQEKQIKIGSRKIYNPDQFSNDYIDANVRYCFYMRDAEPVVNEFVVSQMEKDFGVELDRAQGRTIKQSEMNQAQRNSVKKLYNGLKIASNGKTLKEIFDPDPEPQYKRQRYRRPRNSEDFQRQFGQFNQNNQDDGAAAAQQGGDNADAKQDQNNAAEGTPQEDNSENNDTEEEPKKEDNADEGARKKKKAKSDARKIYKQKQDMKEVVIVQEFKKIGQKKKKKKKKI